MAARQRRPAAEEQARASQQIDGRELRSIVIVAVPPVRTLDLFGPAEVFGDANDLSGNDVYQVRRLSSTNDRVITSHLGHVVHTDQTFREFSGPIDTLLVAGGSGSREKNHAEDFLAWLRAKSGEARRFGSICTGAFVLAEAGLLDGRRAATHWNWTGDLARDYPKVAVDPHPIFVRDGNCYTSAGVTAGIDLCLSLVEEDLGRPAALEVAQMMVVFLRRPGGQSQFSATLVAQIGENRPLADLLAWLPDNLRADLSIAKLARRAAMSPRNFRRLFGQEIGKTPGRHIEDLRLEATRRLLEASALSIAEIAEAAGLGSSEVLRRLFKRRLGVTPGQYRSSFGEASIS